MVFKSRWVRVATVKLVEHERCDLVVTRFAMPKVPKQPIVLMEVEQSRRDKSLWQDPLGVTRFARQKVSDTT